MKNEVSDLVADIKEHVEYLHELGVDSLSVTLSEVKGSPATADVTPFTPLEVPEIPAPKRTATKPSQSGSRLASLPSLTKRTPVRKVETDGGDAAVIKSVAEPAAAKDEILFGDIAGLPESDETMEQIWADIGNCIRCPLHEGRTQIVQTVGNYNADLMFIGEAPGRDEDAQGEPFVGRAGQLLTKIIEAIGMTRAEVCIGNINRCRPPANRQPTLPEAHTCKPFLLREIAVIRPKVIVVMGNTALHNLLDTKVGITR